MSFKSMVNMHQIIHNRQFSELEFDDVAVYGKYEWDQYQYESDELQVYGEYASYHYQCPAVNFLNFDSMT